MEVFAFPILAFLVHCGSRYLSRSVEKKGEVSKHVEKRKNPKKLALQFVETPALLLDMNIFEGNLIKMRKMILGFNNVMLRPHAKAHKCSALALKQIEIGGAVGVCCQKLCEAEAMVYGGVKDVFVSNEIVEKSKIDRLVELARQANISVCVDNPAVVNMIAGAVKVHNDSDPNHPIMIDVLVDVNVGQNRCGVEPGSDVVALAQLIKGHRNELRFKGIHAYHGALQHVRSHADRKSAVYIVSQKAKYCVDMLKKEGIKCQIVTGGGTGTFQFEATSGVYNEVQPGSYIFMDADYNKNLNEHGIAEPLFGQSLFVYTTVISKSRGRVVVDAGTKAISLDSGVPILADYPSLVYTPGGDEHGIITYPEAGHSPDLDNLNIGDKIRLIPGHCDPTVNLYKNIVGIRDEFVESILDIEASGPGI